jgi:hypothetical protein
MNAGITEEVGKGVAGYLSVMRESPLALSVILMNIALLFFFYWILSVVAAQRKEEVVMLHAGQTHLREMLGACTGIQGPPATPRPFSRPQNSRSESSSDGMKLQDAASVPVPLPPLRPLLIPKDGDP